MHLEPQHVVWRNYPVDNFQIMHMKNEDETWSVLFFIYIYQDILMGNLAIDFLKANGGIDHTNNNRARKI